VLLDYILDLKLTKEQELQIKEVLVNSWKKNNRGEIKSTLDVCKFFSLQRSDISNIKKNFPRIRFIQCT
jgi:hypothetical protein